jgi:hypothetical protein
VPERDGELQQNKVVNLIPATPAVPAAAANQQNDKYDDEKRGGIHVETPPGSAYTPATTTNAFDPYPFL